MALKTVLKLSLNMSSLVDLPSEKEVLQGVSELLTQATESLKESGGKINRTLEWRADVEPD